MERFYPFLFVFLWSTGFIGAKFGLPYAEPLSFLLTRYGLVIALMTVLALVTRAPWPETGCTSGFPAFWFMRFIWVVFLSPSSMACRPG